MDIGQASSDPVVVEGQLFVVDTEQVQHSCVEVVPRDRMLGDLPADFIGLAEGDARSQSRTGEPAGKCVFVVISAPANHVRG